MPEDKLVHSIKTKTRTYIEIHETGSQRGGLRKIELSILEAELVYRQLEDVLYGVKEDECDQDSTSNPFSE